MDTTDGPENRDHLRKQITARLAAIEKELLTTESKSEGLRSQKTRLTALRTRLLENPATFEGFSDDVNLLKETGVL